MKNVPRIIIAGTQSGVGKTSVSLALMAAFERAGHRVQAFKVGPDYIDPSYHKIATGYPSHNLDSWLLSQETINWLFQTKSESVDISIIEGVMGLYDGLGGKEETASTAQIAKLLKAPVILVLDARNLSRSAAAIVKGYQSFDPEIKICGVILNKVGSVKHLELLKEAIEYYTDVPVVGAIFRDQKVQIPERHLGLMTASENMELHHCLNSLIELTKGKVELNQSGIDLEKIFKIAKDVPSLLSCAPSPSIPFLPPLKKENRGGFGIRIGFAYDRAFSFYYQANLDLLNDLGVELIPFSPLKDEKISESISALYFGGGFPEIHANELEKNSHLKSQIRRCIKSGMPVYGECGGLMYLSEFIETLDGKSYSMVGAIPGKIVMAQKLQNFGYKEGKMVEDTILGSKGDLVRGHEFHYSTRGCVDEGTVPYELLSRKSEQTQLEGYVKNSLLASYLHLHFFSNPEWAKKFVQAAKKYQEDKKEVVSKS